MDRKGSSCIFRFWIALFWLYLYQDVYSVRVLDVSILSSSNHTYILIEETATVTCDYKVDNDSGEYVESVHWFSNNEEFYIWNNGTRSSQATGAFSGHIDVRVKDPHKIRITHAGIKMHGELRCDVKSSEGSDSKETMLLVIADVCKEDDWKFNLDKETCTETVHFKCTGFYPKPAPNCGLYDRIKQSYIGSFPFDATTKLPNTTYELSVTRQFEASEVIKHDDVVLRCDIIVYGADYKFRIEKEMFGERGCSANYPQRVEGDDYATGVIETCWKRPANGSVVTYQCDDGDEKETKTITCVDGIWKDESDVTISDQSYCSGSSMIHQMEVIISILTGVVVWFMW